MHIIGNMARAARRYGFWGSLVRTNTGVSSLNFYVIGTTIIGISLLATIQFSIIWEVIHNGLVSSDLSGWAALVGAITTLFASAGVAKSWSNWSEHKYTGKESSGEEEPVETYEPVYEEDDDDIEETVITPRPRKKATKPRTASKKATGSKRTSKKKA